MAFAMKTVWAMITLTVAIVREVSRFTRSTGWVMTTLVTVDYCSAHLDKQSK